MDLCLILAITVVMLLSTVYVVMHLVDQSDKHVDEVRKTKLQYDTIDYWAPTSSESELGIKRDLEKNPNRADGQYGELSLTENGMRMIGSMKHLKKLNLQNSSFKEDWLEYIERLPLTDLNLSSTDISKAGFERIAKIQSLEGLDLQYLRLGDEELLALRQLQHLSRLNLKGAHITNESLRLLADFPQLNDVDLGYTEVNDKGCVYLARIAKLKSIALDNDHVTAVGFSKFTHAHSIRCQHVNLTNSDLEALAKIPGIYDINVAFTPIDMKGLVILSKSNSLRAINASRCSNLTQADADRFSRLRPDCSIHVEWERKDPRND